MNHTRHQHFSISRTAFLSFVFIALCSDGNGAEPDSIPLWTNGAVGSESRMKEAEKIDQGPGKCNVTNVHHPSITPYLPKASIATGTAIIIAPGGGHRMLCLGHEGGALAEWFAENGIAAFVLKYRLAGDWAQRLRQWLRDSRLLLEPATVK